MTGKHNAYYSSSGPRTYRFIIRCIGLAHPVLTNLQALRENTTLLSPLKLHKVLEITAKLRSLESTIKTQDYS